MAASSFIPPTKDLYGEEVDFNALAIQDADFAKVYHASINHIDFHDSKAVQQLTKSLLKRDFGLSIELPDDRLCPPVPIRYSYVSWIQDLLDTTADSEDDDYDPARKVTGLDIGVGSSCIYPLLATSTRMNYTMHGTDIDDQNLTYAERNVKLNNLSSRISIHRSTPESPLVPLDRLNIDSLDFTICNPPFYSSKAELTASEEQKLAPPNAVCTGADVEMIFEGGDAGFVLRMVEESVKFRERVQWYTSMLGKLSSVHEIVARLKELEVGNWAVCCLKAGRKTRRWAVGWSFGDRRPRSDVVRCGDLPNTLHPPPTAQIIHTADITREEAIKVLNTILSELNLRWTWNAETCTGHGSAEENVWSRSARRKQKRLAIDAAAKDRDEAGTGSIGTKVKQNGSDASESRDQVVALGFNISVAEGETEVRWIRGRDYVLFESFCGVLRRAMKVKPADTEY